MQHWRSPSAPKLPKRMLLRSRKKVQLLLTKSTLVIVEVFSLPNVVRVLASEASSIPLVATLKTPRSVWAAEKQDTHVLSVNTEITHVILAVKLVTSRRHAKGNLRKCTSWKDQNPLKLVLSMIRLILFLSRCTIWAQASKVLRYPLNWTEPLF